MSRVGVFSWRTKGSLRPFYYACSIKGMDTRYKWRNLKARGALAETLTAFLTLLQLHMLTAVNSRSNSQLNLQLSSFNERGVALHNGIQ